jgi:hypothetical protein
MTEYPEGVIQNMAPPNCPLQPEPVVQANWRMFSDQETADKGFGMVDAICDNGSMVDAETLGGMYTQFIYLPWAGTVHCRVVNATARDENGAMKICEYPSDIVDRDTVPMPFIDRYTAGQAHTLKVMRITPALGQLYWAAA